jgi:hypothetical protein
VRRGREHYGLSGTVGDKTISNELAQCAGSIRVRIGPERVSSVVAVVSRRGGAAEDNMSGQEAERVLKGAFEPPLVFATGPRIRKSSEREKSPEVDEPLDMSRPVKATSFTVGDNTDESPRVKAPTRVPVVTISASPEISVAVPWVIVAACSTTAPTNSASCGSTGGSVGWRGGICGYIHHLAVTAIAIQFAMVSVRSSPALHRWPTRWSYLSGMTYRDSGSYTYPSSPA